MTSEGIYPNSTVDEDFKVEIPKKVREELDLNSGDEVKWIVIHDRQRAEIVKQQYGAFEDFEPVDIGEDTNAVEEVDRFGSL